MKKLIPFLSIVLLATACNTTPKEAAPTSAFAEQVSQSIQDTSGMAQFQQWKARNELAVNSEIQQPEQKPAAQPVKIKYVTVPSRKTSAPAPVKAPVQTSSDNSSVGSGSDVAGSGTSTSAGEAKAEKKQGISKAVKGAVIGGVAGAAGGAIINKNNRVLGAVIGGVVGAAGGYGIGHTMDKKDGRIE
jgi:hypothetical protein